MFLGDAAEYRRRRQLRQRDVRKLQEQRSSLKPLPLGNQEQLIEREPQLQLVLDRHQRYYQNPTGMHT